MANSTIELVGPDTFFDAYLFDLDGTIYLGSELLPDARELIETLRNQGAKTVFLSNNPTRDREMYITKLTGLGIEVERDEIINTVVTTVLWLKQHHPDAIVFPIAEEPLVNALREAGIRLSEDPAEIDVVVASYDRGFTYRKLQIAFDALWQRDHVKLITTNPDRYCPFPGGKGEPDAAAIVAAIEASAGVTCVANMGKPDRIMIDTVVAELDEALRYEYGVADPGVRLELVATDVPAQVFSKAAGLRFAAVTLLIPHGVVSWNLRVPGRVETSNNLGTIRPTAKGIQLMSTITSAVTSRKHELYNRVRSLVGAVGGGVTMEMFGLDAPEFPYRPDSELLAVASAAYRDVLGGEPTVEVSQCSLELGMFSRRVPVADIISIGTELHGLHSPAEKVNYKSVERVWPLVKEVVSRL